MNELQTFNAQLAEKFEEQVQTKGIDKMVYKMSRGGRTLVGYDKPTLEQLCIDLGLRKEYSELTVVSLPNNDFVVSVKLTLLDGQGKMITTSYGSGQSFETGQKSNDVLRLTPVVQKRALNIALTPLLVRLGLDYQTIAKREKAKDYNSKVEYETTSNVDDLAKNDKPNDNEFISIERAKTLMLRINELQDSNKWNDSNFKKALDFVLVEKNKINAETIAEFDYHETLISSLSNRDYDLLLETMTRMKVNKKGVEK